jgi:N-acetylglucosamine kinase-like BadF-type ATPase
MTVEPVRLSLLERAQRLHTALNAMDLNTAVAMINPSAKIRTPMRSLTGGEAYREWISQHFRAFPDMRHEIRGLAAESNQTIGFEWRATGTFARLSRLPRATFPRTARPLISLAQYDNLAALRILEQEAQQQRRAVASALESLQLFTNRYKGGVDTYLQVITAQTTALANERNQVDILRRRMDASVLLVKALGGAWNVADLPQL